MIVHKTAADALADTTPGGRLLGNDSEEEACRLVGCEGRIVTEPRSGRPSRELVGYYTLPLKVMRGWLLGVVEKRADGLDWKGRPQLQGILEDLAQQRGCSVEELPRYVPPTVEPAAEAVLSPALQETTAAVEEPLLDLTQAPVDEAVKPVTEITMNDLLVND